MRWASAAITEPLVRRRALGDEVPRQPLSNPSARSGGNVPRPCARQVPPMKWTDAAHHDLNVAAREFVAGLGFSQLLFAWAADDVKSRNWLDGHLFGHVLPPGDSRCAMFISSILSSTPSSQAWSWAAPARSGRRTRAAWPPAVSCPAVVSGTRQSARARACG